jgi:hypothetical protein
MSTVGETRLEASGGGGVPGAGVARNEDLESQTQQAEEMKAYDDEEPQAAKAIDVRESERLFNNLESKLASESAAE